MTQIEKCQKIIEYLYKIRFNSVDIKGISKEEKIEFRDFEISAIIDFLEINNLIEKPKRTGSNEHYGIRISSKCVNLIESGALIYELSPTKSYMSIEQFNILFDNIEEIKKQIKYQTESDKESYDNVVKLLNEILLGLKEGKKPEGAIKKIINYASLVASIGNLVFNINKFWIQNQI